MAVITSSPATKLQTVVVHNGVASTIGVIPSAAIESERTTTSGLLSAGVPVTSTISEVTNVNGGSQRTIETVTAVSYFTVVGANQSSSSPATSVTASTENLNDVHQTPLAAIVAPVCIGVVTFAIVLSWATIRARRRRWRSHIPNIAVMPEMQISWPHHLIEEPPTELDGVQRHEAETRERRQEMDTDAGGGYRGHATAFERLISRLLGRTVESDAQQRSELEVVERPQEMDAKSDSS